MSIHNVFVDCPCCDASDAIEIKVNLYPSFGESYSRSTGWSPAEAGSFDFETPNACDRCQATFTTKEIREIDTDVEGVIEAEFGLTA